MEKPGLVSPTLFRMDNNRRPAGAGEMVATVMSDRYIRRLGEPETSRNTISSSASDFATTLFGTDVLLKLDGSP